MKKNLFLQNISSVLIIKFGGIGDVLLSTPVVENLNSFSPHLFIDLLTERSAADVVVGNRSIRNVLSFRKKTDSAYSLIQTVRRQKYDAVIDLYSNPRTALVTKLSGAKFRIGFPFRGRGYAYNYHIPPRGGEVHNVDFNLDALRLFGIPIRTADPFFPVSDADKSFADEWFRQQKFGGETIIGMNPSGGWYTKRWGKQSFASLADAIHDWKRWKVIIFWGPGEYDDAVEILKIMKAPGILAPKSTLPQMAALIGKTSYFISNDAGPMHIAAAVGIPTLGIYGPTSPHLQGPYGKKNLWIRNEEIDCLECNLTRCPIGNICMTDLNVETVFASFKKLVTMNQ